MIIQKNRKDPLLTEKYFLFPNPKFLRSTLPKKPALLTSFKEIQRETVDLLESLQIHDLEDLKDMLKDPNASSLINQIGEKDWQTLIEISKSSTSRLNEIPLLIDSESLYMYIGPQVGSTWLMSIYWNDLLIVYISSQITVLVNKFQKIIKKLHPINPYYLVPSDISIYLPKNYLSMSSYSIGTIADLLQEKGYSFPENPEEYSIAIALFSNLTNVSDGTPES